MMDKNSSMFRTGCVVISMNDEFKVKLSYAGECGGGSYPEDLLDEKDGPLLRADLYRRIDNDANENFCDEASASVCTGIPADIDMATAWRYADAILNKLRKGLAGKVSDEKQLVEAVYLAEDEKVA